MRHRAEAVRPSKSKVVIASQRRRSAEHHPSSRPGPVIRGLQLKYVAGLIPARRQISATGIPSAPCFKMNAFCGSENFDAFIVFHSSQPREEMGGASMTISNLGSIAGTAFTSIVNPPKWRSSASREPKSSRYGTARHSNRGRWSRSTSPTTTGSSTASLPPVSSHTSRGSSPTLPHAGVMLVSAERNIYYGDISVSEPPTVGDGRQIAATEVFIRAFARVVLPPTRRRRPRWRCDHLCTMDDGR